MKLQVKEIMTRSVVSVSTSDDIDTAVSLMIRHNVSGIPVVDDDHVLQGVITERDLLCLLTNIDTDRKYVTDYASLNAVVVHENTSLVEVADLMTSHSYRRLPVVDPDGKLVGVISRRDLIRFIRDLRVRLACVLGTRQVV